MYRPILRVLKPLKRLENGAVLCSLLISNLTL